MDLFIQKQVNLAEDWNVRLGRWMFKPSLYRRIHWYLNGIPILYLYISARYFIKKTMINEA